MIDPDLGGFPPRQTLAGAPGVPLGIWGFLEFWPLDFELCFAAH